MKTGDHILRAVVCGGEAVLFVAETANCVETARNFHKTAPTASAAFGRLLTGSLMLGAMQKNKDDVLTVQIKCDGELAGMLATADSLGHVKGYILNPLADLPLNSKGKLDVSGVVGTGEMTVIKDLGLKEPYVGKVPIVSGEIAEDFAYYFAVSEQTPTVVALGVLVDRDCSIKQAGGFIISLLPGASENTVKAFEDKVKNIKSVTEMLDSGMTTYDILSLLCEGMEVGEIQKNPCEYRCDCGREKVEKAVISIGKDELAKIIEEDEKAEVCCHFCDKKYEFTRDELKVLLKDAK